MWKHQNMSMEQLDSHSSMAGHCCMPIVITNGNDDDVHVQEAVVFSLKISSLHSTAALLITEALWQSMRMTTTI